MLKITNIKYPVDKEINIKILTKKIAKILRVSDTEIKDIKISKKSVDARDKSNIFYVLSLDFKIKNEDKYLSVKNVCKSKEYKLYIPKKSLDKRPVIVGFGPAGMFASLILARAGLQPIVIERGNAVEKRLHDVSDFWKTGKLNTESNVQFGEGGAGTFSDGKLTTGIKSNLMGFVLNEFVKASAPKEILYLAKPHIGTDNLVTVVKNIREEIKALGGTVLFGHKLTDICINNGYVKSIIVTDSLKEQEIFTDNLILSIGHSARDTFEMLATKPILIEPKSFSVGVRIEHKQEMINSVQYGEFAKYLSPADYKVAVHLPNGRSAYTFCMCPGGFVVASASEEGMLATNGMSYFKRDATNANSALLIGVSPEDFKDVNPLSGIEFQRNLERNAFNAGGGNYAAPIQTVGDLLKEQKTHSIGSIQPTYRPSTVPSDLSTVFPDYIYDSLKLAVIEINKKIKGFADDNAVLTAVESRSSSPIRIVRDKISFESNVKGLYPCGEGGGYAGGIISAAIDGINCAKSILE